MDVFLKEYLKLYLILFLCIYIQINMSSESKCVCSEYLSLHLGLAATYGRVTGLTAGCVNDLKYCD